MVFVPSDEWWNYCYYCYGIIMVESLGTENWPIPVICQVTTYQYWTAKLFVRHRVYTVMSDVASPRCVHQRCIDVRGNDVNYCIQQKAITLMKVSLPKPRCDHDKCQAVQGDNIDHCIINELNKFHARSDVVARHHRMHLLVPNPMYCNICAGIKMIDKSMRSNYKHVSFLGQ